MSGVNKVILVGKLDSDPEVKESTLGSIVRLRVAVTEEWTKKDGTKGEFTEWHTVAIYDDRCQALAQTLRKGAIVYLEGQIKTRKWKDKEGKDRLQTEITLPKFRGVLARLDGGTAVGGTPRKVELDDEIPF